MTLLCIIFKIEKTSRIRNIAMLVAFPYLLVRIGVKVFGGADWLDYGEVSTNLLPFLFMPIVIISSAIANIFNKKFLTGTKVSIPQFALFVYLFALPCTFVLYMIENFCRYGNLFELGLLPAAGLSRAEEVINIVLFN